MKKIKKLKEQWIVHSPSSRLYHLPVPIIGLTGGIATGKSSVAELFQQDNIPVIDADKLVKTIYQTKEAFEFVTLNFPEAISNNSIDFKTLREKVFTNTDNQKKIENFIYQRLPEAFKKAFENFSNASFIVYDVPLLFEKGLDKFIDVSVCVYAPQSIQLSRLVKRDHIELDLAKKIIAKQMDIEDKKKLSHLFIDNSNTIESLKSNYQDLINQLVVHE